MIISFLNNIINRYNSTLKDDNGITAPTEKQILKLLKREKFSSYFPVRAYDPIENCYYNADGTVGFIWEVTPVAYASASLYDTIAHIIKSMPQKCVFQTILHADNDIDPILHRYLSIHKKDPAGLCAKTALLFKNASVHGFKTMARIPARNFRCFVAIKTPNDEDAFDEIKFLRDSVYEVLRGGLSPRYFEPQELCRWLQKILLPKTDLPGGFRYDDTRPINQQILTGGSSIRVEYDHLKVGDNILKIQTIKDYPLKSLNDLTINRVIGGIMGVQDDTNQYNFPFLAVTNIIKDDLSYKIQSKAGLMMFQEKKGTSVGHQMTRQNELLRIKQEMDAGNVFVRVIPTIISFNKNIKAASENSARIKRLWESCGFTTNNDRGILLILFISSLPFGLYYTKNIVEFLERDRIMSAESAARLLPIQGDFSGLGEPVSIFSGRKGQIIPLDLFYPESPSNNTIITAKTGQGKSYLMNRLLTDYWSIGTVLRVFDLGKSYKKLSRILKGQFIEFSKESVHCINPFSNVRDINEDISLLSLIICQMVWSSSGGKPNETQISIIKTVIRDVWANYGNDDVHHIDLIQLALIDFKNVLKRNKIEFSSGLKTIIELARELAFNLSDFTIREQGVYGRWFNGQSTINVQDEQFVVYELEELRAQPDLFKPVSMQVVNYTTQGLYLSDRSRKTLIVFDEAWKWFDERSFLGDVIQEGYRVARKYLGAFITIFQSLQDLIAFGKGGEVIRENSEYKFLLKSDYKVAKNKGLLHYEDFIMNLLDKVELQKGRYSEMFIQTPFSAGVARLPSDLYSHLTFTSDPRDNRIIEEITGKYNISIEEAIEFLVKDHEKNST